MALSEVRIIDNYINRVKARVSLNSEVEQEIRTSIGDLIEAIIDEIKNNAEITNGRLDNPTGLIAPSGPVTGATLPNSISGGIN